MTDDLELRRVKRMTSAELTEHVINIAESVLLHITAGDEALLRAQIETFRNDNAVAVTAAERSHEECRKLCEMVTALTSDVPLSPDPESA